MLEDINTIKKEITEYIEVRFDYIKLHTAENLSKFISNSASVVIIGYLLFFILFFTSFAAGYYFAERFNSNQLGFLCVGAFYAIVLILFLIFRKQIIERPIIKAIVKLFFQN